MAVLTPQQIAVLRGIFQDASTGLAISVFGYQVPADELERLIAGGYIDPQLVDNLVEKAAQHGVIMAGNPGAENWPLRRLTSQLKSAPPPLSAAEMAAVQVAQARAGEYCVGLGNRYSERLGRVIVEADADQAARLRGKIADEVASATANRLSRSQLATNLRQSTEDWGRDWERIATTETQSAQQEGWLESTLERHGPDAMAAKIPDPGACPQCLRLYTDGGTPKIRPISWWIEQGQSNAGRKQADWRPTVGPAHPHCRCQFIRVPAGMEIDASGVLFVPQDKAEKSLASPLDQIWEDQLRKAREQLSLFGGGGAWQPIPGGAKGGQRRRAGAGWEYRYPGQPTARRMAIARDPDLIPASTATVYLNASAGTEKARFRKLDSGLAAKNLGIQILAKDIPKGERGFKPYVEAARRSGLKVMVDSGAFGHFKAGKGDLDFPQVFADYGRMAAAMPPGTLTVVAPDRIGDPEGTTELRHQYRDAVKGLLARGANVIVPIQARDSAGIVADYHRVTELFGNGVQIGIPTAARPIEMDVLGPALVDIYQTGARPKVHFLGGARPRPMAERIAQTVAAAYFTDRGVEPKRVKQLIATSEKAVAALRRVASSDAIMSREGDLLEERVVGWWKEEHGISAEEIDDTEMWEPFFEAHPEEFDNENEDPERTFRELASQLTQFDTSVLSTLQQHGLAHTLEGKQEAAPASVMKHPKVERHLSIADEYLRSREFQQESRAPSYAGGHAALLAAVPKMVIAPPSPEAARKRAAQKRQRRMEKVGWHTTESGPGRLVYSRWDRAGSVLVEKDGSGWAVTARGSKALQLPQGRWVVASLDAARERALHTMEAHPLPNLAPATAEQQPLFKSQGGPFIGPRGGRWADARHTIPWKEDQPSAPKAPEQLDLFALGRQALAEKLAKPTEWGLPAGARVSDPWEPKPINPNAKWSHPDHGDGRGAAPWDAAGWTPDLSSYDYLVINSSAGKDSQAMLTHLVEVADRAGFPREKIVVVHADLGRVEWEGTKELAQEQAEHYGLRFEVVQREQNDLVEQIEERHGDLMQRQADQGRLIEAGIGSWELLATADPARVLEVIGAEQNTSKDSDQRRSQKLVKAAAKKLAKIEAAREKKLEAARSMVAQHQYRMQKLADHIRRRGDKGPLDSQRERMAKMSEQLRDKADAVTTLDRWTPAQDPLNFGKPIAWPSSDARYCTSDHKRAEVKKLHTALGEEWRAAGGEGAPRILNTLGIRAQESESRAKMDGFEREDQTSGKVVDRWYPIKQWPEERVWNVIRDSGVPYHKAYQLGMRRLSCVFCVFAQREDLMVAAKHNPSLFRTYLKLEQKVGASFKANESLESIRAEIEKRRSEGLELNSLAQWVKKSLELDVDDALIKADLAHDPPAVGMVLEAARARIEDVMAVQVEWKARGACVHLDTAQDSHHVLYLSYPDAYNASMVVAAFAERHHLTLEEHNAPPPLDDADDADLHKSQGGPYIGPRGGRWADAAHTIPWHDGGKYELRISEQPGLGFSVKSYKDGALAGIVVLNEPKVISERAQSLLGGRPAVFVGWVHVNNEHRSKGIGRSLYELAFKEADRRGLAVVRSDEAGSTIEPGAAHIWGDVLVKSGGPYIGPRGGKWDDPEHTIPWHEGGAPRAAAAEEEKKPRKAAAADPEKRKPGKSDDQAEQPDLTAPKVGQKITVTPSRILFTRGDGRSEDFEVTAVNSDTGKLKLGEFGPIMPVASLKHFVNDLAGKIDVPPDSGRPEIDAVSSGAAELLGKGDDGIAFKVGDKVVKVSTTVPYQPTNPGHRTPEQAADMLEAQVQMGNHLADLGIEGVQRSEFVRHGDKGFQIKPWVEIPEKFTRAQLDAVQDTLIAIHKAGYAIRDKVQPGIGSDGKPVMFDVGKAAPQSDATGIYSDVQSDMDEMRQLYEEHGQAFVRRDFSEAAKQLEKVKDDWDRLLASPDKKALGFARFTLERTVKKLEYEARATMEGDKLAKRLSDIEDDVWYLRAELEGAEEKKAAEEAGGEVKKAETVGDLHKAARKLQARIRWNGLDISIENRVGSLRHWYDPHSKEEGSTKMRNAYGYIRRTEANDGEHIDCYMGPDESAPNVYVVHQRKAPDFTRYDEDKCMLFFRTRAEAVRAYLAHYDDPRFLGPVTVMPVERFVKKALASPDNNEQMIKADIQRAVYEHARPGHVSTGAYKVDREGGYGVSRVIDATRWMQVLEELARDKKRAQRLLIDAHRLDVPEDLFQLYNAPQFVPTDHSYVAGKDNGRNVEAAAERLKQRGQRLVVSQQTARDTQRWSGRFRGDE